jgi:hypothetical protein
MGQLTNDGGERRGEIDLRRWNFAEDGGWEKKIELFGDRLVQSSACA